MKIKKPYIWPLAVSIISFIFLIVIVNKVILNPNGYNLRLNLGKPPPAFTMKHFSVIGNKRYYFEVNTDILASFPDYDDPSKLPLSNEEAISKAKSEINKYVPSQDLARWNTFKVEPTQLGNTHKWYLLVDVTPDDETIVNGHGEQVVIPVLLDGTVISGKRR